MRKIWNFLDFPLFFYCNSQLPKKRIHTFKYIFSLFIWNTVSQSFLLAPFSSVLIWVCTVCAKRSESICFLWYNLIVLWPIQSTLKSAAKPIFLSFPNKYRSDLSKKLVFGPVGQGASKMYAFKVCAGRDSNPGRSESSDLLHKVAKNVASNPNCLSFFLIANFASLLFCSQLIYKNIKYLI